MEIQLTPKRLAQLLRDAQLLAAGVALYAPKYERRAHAAARRVSRLHVSARRVARLLLPEMKWPR